ncbi:MAG: HD domain-containing protein [Patescibacteria group bacterium]
MTSDLVNLIKFLEFTNKFQQIKRTIFVPNELPQRFENDAEHTLQITLVAWYLIDSKNLPLNKELAIKYALVHDLVEVYAGDLDPFMHTNDPDFELKKAKNEAKAFSKIKQSISEFSDLHKYIQAYEQKEDEESIFIYSLDKLVGKLNVTELDKRSFKDCGISYSSAKKRFLKIEKSPYIKPYIDEISKLWKIKQDFYAETDFLPEYKKQFIHN